MSFMDKVKNVFGIPNEEDYYDEPIGANGEEDDYYDEQPKKNKVVNLNSANLAQLQVVFKKPEKFEDVSAIADCLKEKNTVVLNLEIVSRDVARRLIDFLSGVAYANGGQINRVSNGTFIVTPCNVEVSGEFPDELVDTSEICY